MILAQAELFGVFVPFILVALFLLAVVFLYDISKNTQRIVELLETREYHTESSDTNGDD
ncbi:hypothetical protein [Halorubrum trueperi]|uniref:CcoQ/FixQ family Cbb3-type cytochrome c oxidase assembly chaperone n=1 Tax=Halorubrum trueperi TaxID=2004704 RepID=A0ABD5UKK4_9EURY